MKYWSSHTGRVSLTREAGPSLVTMVQLLGSLWSNTSVIGSNRLYLTSRRTLWTRGCASNRQTLAPSSGDLWGDLTDSIDAVYHVYRIQFTTNLYGQLKCQRYTNWCGYWEWCNSWHLSDFIANFLCSIYFTEEASVTTASADGTSRKSQFTAFLKASPVVQLCHCRLWWLQRFRW